ncbi:NAD(P)-dependent dehydrogenase, short-chain alcohol dehydrogenase family [Vibrio gazogenes DSM 21264]|uniref:NAD(P)-dependent dehydrogenase, short-chain alcohol dehydrogenase family n=2 Tax=Vibrio gazogenes TaxID=687 RepID=A0A1M5CK38_VIBGA|nr:oxidoreductase [Vibrio gazogenes]SHF55078.1 NAD(P)-dependent dehydrogenase, short-chain alcohol dehydrogenase family [Vibrio gazogenes DSM 21264] [Vibrio gazogenes DSM 21264 = NBRC 103151]SJN53733.1 2,3-dihydro-2,3-dihydroxybenzoate dehydrogenase [Vibrio gazogenes]
MSNQRKISSVCFNHESTASDVLQNVDVSGKRVLITGGHSGLGFETTKAFSNAGAFVTVASRNTEEALNKCNDLRNVDIKEIDLFSLQSVHKFCELLISNNTNFDYIICNAGVMACDLIRTDNDWESQFATNHLGHFVMVNLLMTILNDKCRVIVVSSAGHHNSPIRWSDIHFHNGYDKWLAYGQSKTANILFALQLDIFARERGVRAFSLHPGKIFTPLQRHLNREEMVSEGWIDANGNAIDPTFKSPEQGAATAVWAATSPELDDLGGLYCEDCNVSVLFDHNCEPFTGVRDYAISREEALKLWEYSAKITGVNFFN